MYVTKSSVERLLYASGAGRQGRVSCELQKINHTLPALAPSLFAPTQRRTNLVRGGIKCISSYFSFSFYY